MEKLTALVHNFNTKCHKHFTNVSPLLGEELDKILEDIEHFYYSSFWTNRFKRRMNEEDEDWIPIQLDIVQGVTSDLKDTTKFKMFTEDSNTNGSSDNNVNIALNTEMSKEKLNNSHIKNVIMHEFGHKQYDQKAFNLIISLNKRIIEKPEEHIKCDEVLNRKDYKYFIDHNEIRQRIIPIVKEMRDNNWKLSETYDKSENLKMDDIKDIFTREYILKLIDNLL